MDDLARRLQELEDGLPATSGKDRVMDKRSERARTVVGSVAAIALGLVVAGGAFGLLSEPLGIGATSTPSATPSAQFSDEPFSPRVSPGPSSVQSPGPGADYVGVLYFFDVCPMLAVDDEGYELILPRDQYRFRMEDDGVRIFDRAGNLIASQGDRIAIDGRRVSRGSYCMVGPQIAVSDITVLPR